MGGGTEGGGFDDSVRHLEPFQDAAAVADKWRRAQEMVFVPESQIGSEYSNFKVSLRGKKGVRHVE